MTLIIGIVMPNGILLASDTRGTYSLTGEVATDYKKKILTITPNFDLAGSGSESNWYTSKILRDCLHNTLFLNPSRYTNTEIREIILNLYRQVNNLHKTNHPNGYPVGQLLVSEFDNSNCRFNLLHQCGTEGFNAFNVFNNVKDVEVIGSSLEIRNNVKVDVHRELNMIPQEIFNHNGGFIIVAEMCHKIIKNQNDSGIGKNIYCSYLTQRNGVSSHCRFLIKENGEDHFFGEDDGQEEIVYLSE